MTEEEIIEYAKHLSEDIREDWIKIRLEYERFCQEENNEYIDDSTTLPSYWD